jgi:hypothetical protein
MTHRFFTIPLIAALVGLAVTGSALAQRATSMAGTPGFAHGQHHWIVDGIPPLPPGCLRDMPSPPLHPALPDFTLDARWQTTLGISAAQARQVQQVLEQQTRQRHEFDEQRRSQGAAGCEKIRSIIGDKAMAKWAEASPLPPPPRPPMPPAPPTPPAPPVDAQ